MYPAHLRDYKWKHSSQNISVVLSLLHYSSNVNVTVLFSYSDPAAKALWESFMNLKQKEAVMEARRHLVEAASRENLPIKMSMGE